MYGFELETVFATMIGLAVLLLFRAFVVPVFGENRQARLRMKSRLRAVAEEGDMPRQTSLVRERYLRQLHPWLQWLESLSVMESLGRVIEQAGRESPAYRIVLSSAFLGATAAFATFFVTQKIGVTVIITLAAAGIPFFLLFHARGARLAKFEEQLPDALATMSRALKAGYPFSETLKLVADELDEPVAKEFDITFNDVNYGGDLKVALAGLLTRVPSVTVMAFVSAVSIQKESGGNLAELFDKLESVIRGRYKFKRTMLTLTAEGRLSAWIMSLFPFVLGGILSLVNPELMPMLIHDPKGQKLILIAFALMAAGILWMSRIVRVDV